MWETSLLDCIRSPLYLLHMCVCHSCVWGNALSKVGVRDARVLACLSLSCPFGMGRVCAYVGRREVVHRYRSQEKDAESVAISCCLHCCERLQEVDTLLAREKWTCTCTGRIVERTHPMLRVVPMEMVECGT